MNKGYRYRAHGLTFASDLALPELRPSAPVQEADIRISLVPRIPGMPDDGDEFDFMHTEAGVSMHVHGAASYVVRDGSRIDVCPVPDADQGLLHLYLIGSAIGMALHQRGILAMHASAVVCNGNATLFVGDSGAGKSTLAARFGQAGHPVLADDVLALGIDVDGNVTAWPGSVSFKLWDNSLAGLGMQASGLPQVANRTDKYYVDNTCLAEDRPYPVSRIVVLERATDGGGHALHALPQLEAVKAIADNTYRPEYLRLVDRHAGHFQQCARAASRIPVLRLTRPWDIGSIDATMAFIVGLDPHAEAGVTSSPELTP